MSIDKASFLLLITGFVKLGKIYPKIYQNILHVNSSIMSPRLSPPNFKIDNKPKSIYSKCKQTQMIHNYTEHYLSNRNINSLMNPTKPI